MAFEMANKFHVVPHYPGKLVSKVGTPFYLRPLPFLYIRNYVKANVHRTMYIRTNMDMILTSLEKSAQSITNMKRGKIGLCRNTLAVDHNNICFGQWEFIHTNAILLAQNHNLLLTLWVLCVVKYQYCSILLKLELFTHEGRIISKLLLPIVSTTCFEYACINGNQFALWGANDLLISIWNMKPYYHIFLKSQGSTQASARLLIGLRMHFGHYFLINAILNMTERALASERNLCNIYQIIT